MLTPRFAALTLRQALREAWPGSANDPAPPTSPPTSPPKKASAKASKDKAGEKGPQVPA